MKNKLKSGQARIIEAVMASILIFIAFTTAFFMLFSSEKFFKQETVDLNRLAYNVLHRLAESGVLNEIDATKMRRVLHELLPQNIYFNLTVYETGNLNGWSPVLNISNASPEIFEKSSEVVSAGITYTSGMGKTYYLSLKLTRAGLT